MLYLHGSRPSTATTTTMVTGVEQQWCPFLKQDRRINWIIRVRYYYYSTVLIRHIHLFTGGWKTGQDMPLYMYVLAKIPFRRCQDIIHGRSCYRIYQDYSALLVPHRTCMTDGQAAYPTLCAHRCGSFSVSCHPQTKPLTNIIYL